MRKTIIFIISYIIWVFLVWPYNLETGQVDFWSLGVGILASILVALLFSDVFVKRHVKAINPLRYLWFLLYIPIFSFYCILANIDVMYRVIHPKMPINPGIVEVPTDLETRSGLTALANSITLTPGTLTVDVDREEGILYVHWINVEGEDLETTREKISGRFEWILRRIFE